MANTDEDMWTKHVQIMKEAILNNNNIRTFFETFEPDKDEGFCWTKNNQYKHYSNILDNKTGRVHSGASFAICLRCALFEIKNEKTVIIGKEVPNDETLLNVPFANIIL